MSEKYTGKAEDRRYTGESLDISYSARRCIHAEECVRRLSAVFDTKRKPWILPDAGNSEDIMAELHHCPSGALHYEPKDGSAEEAIPAENVIILWHNGPLQVRGNLAIEGATVSIENETRATLCRCGASQNKPFCDNAHKEIDFVAEDTETIKIESREKGGKLKITAGYHDSLELEGNFRIETEDGKVLYEGSQTWLCRCGHSSNKPFCDSTHKKIGFDAD